MKTTIISTLITTTALVLSGCASKYIEPAAGPDTAVLTLRAGNGARAAGFFLQLDKECKSAAFLGGVSQNPAWVINLSGEPVLTKKSINVKVGEPFKFQVFDVRNGAFAMHTCGIAKEFTPEFGFYYVATFGYQGMSCTLTLSRTHPDGKFEFDAGATPIKYCDY